MTTAVWLHISGLDCFACIDTLLKILFKISAVHIEKLPQRGRVFYNLQAHMQRKPVGSFSVSVCKSVWLGVFLCGRIWRAQQQTRVWSSLQTRRHGYKRGCFVWVLVFQRHRSDISFVLSLQEATLRFSMPSVPVPPFLYIPQHAQRIWIIELCVCCANVWRAVGFLQSWLELSMSHAASHVLPASCFLLHIND